jgi:uncharacterized protein YigA (DUF484 family)
MIKVVDDLNCEIDHNRTVVVDRRLLERARTEIQRLEHAVSAMQFQLDISKAEAHQLRGRIGRE